MKLILTNYKHGIGLFGFKDNRLIKANLYTNNQDICVGDIVVGKVIKNLERLNAYFVNVNSEVEAFVPYSEADKQYKCGENILVQIKKEAAKGKQPMGTTKLALEGYSLIIHHEPHCIQVSKKLSKEDRDFWKNTLQTVLKSDTISAEEKDILTQYRVIVRTNVTNVTDVASVISEWILLAKKMHTIVTKGNFQSLYTKVNCSTSRYINEIKNIPYYEMDEIVTDDRAVFDELVENFSFVDDMKQKIRLYQDDFSICKVYSIDTKLQETLQKKVWLKSGGFLVIEPTEALTVIDVNSGKFDKKKEAEEYYSLINKEAATEIALQLKLRNISGIIVIDFINMKSPKYNEELLQCFSKYVSDDKVKTTVVGMTALGLVEVTREKIEKPLWEQMTD